MRKLVLPLAHPLQPDTVGRVGPGMMRMEELAWMFTGCGTQESWSPTSHLGSSTVELALRV